MPTYTERTCALCGCQENEHGGTGTNDHGEYSEEICTGCGAECPFEESDEDEEEDDE